MVSYTRGFDFDMGSLGRNLATIDEDISRFIQSAKEESATRGESDLKAEAPWTETGLKNRWGRTSTGKARDGLWAESYGDAHNGGIRMGHTAEYGIYLEDYMGKRFQVVMPVLVRTGRAFMRSLEDMFAQLHGRIAVTPIITPGGGAPSTGVTEAYRRPREYFRDARGRFVSARTSAISKVKSVTKRTRRTRRR